MFDIGFPELLLLGIVALLVLGPERLPDTMRTLGLWIGRMRRFTARIRREIEQEIGADEIRRQLHNEEILRDLREVNTELQSTSAEMQQSILTPMPTAKDGAAADDKKATSP